MSKIKTYDVGLSYEDNAIKFLHSLDLEVLKTRYKTNEGEIDIICKKDSVLHFIEVKYRKEIQNYETLISPEQWERIKNASQLFLQKFWSDYKNYDYQYDMIAFNGSTMKIDYIENLWI